MSNESRKVIGFTGLDGTGKSTQIKILEKSLKNHGFSVVTVHQYEPVFKITAISKAIFRKTFKKFQNMFVKPGTSILEEELSKNNNYISTHSRKNNVLGTLLSFWWLSSGWWRAIFNFRKYSSVDFLLLDRCYIDEIVRSEWKTNNGTRLGYQLIKKSPIPDLVIYFYGDESVTWNRKKEKNSSKEEYFRKKEVVENAISNAENLWPIKKINIDLLTLEEISTDIEKSVVEK